MKSPWSKIDGQLDHAEAVTKARQIMKSELQSRFFDLRPSNIRLVQCFMSKQPGFECKIYLKDAQYQVRPSLPPRPCRLVPAALAYRASLPSLALGRVWKAHLGNMSRNRSEVVPTCDALRAAATK